MRGVILNELELLDKSLKEGYIDDKKPTSTLRILCKYYLSKGCKQDKVVELLSNFMSDNYCGYNESNWEGKIKGIVKSVKKYNNLNIINVNSICITENEWNNILKLKNNHLERVAFILLVYQKINQIKNPDSNGWINCNSTDRCVESNVKLNKEEKGMLLHNLYKINYISQKQSCDATGLLLNYIDNNSKDKISIDNFTNVISYYYEYKNNEKWKECKCCGKRFKLKTINSPQKYCSKCAKKNKQLKINECKIRNKK